MQKFYIFLGGRSMTAFWFILAVGSALAYADKLTPSFAALASVILACVHVRAVSQDKYCGCGACPSAPDQNQPATQGPAQG
jgi:hypothetical protein